MPSCRFCPILVDLYVGLIDKYIPSIESQKQSTYCAFHRSQLHFFLGTDRRACMLERIEVEDSIDDFARDAGSCPDQGCNAIQG